MILARSNRHFFRVAVLTACSFLIVPSCGDDAATGAGGGSASSSSGGDDENVVFEGGASDEGYREMKAVAPIDEPTQGSTFTTPTDGAKLSATEPATFSWQVGAGGSFLRLDPSNGGRAADTRPGGGAFLTLLLAGVGEAHAHGDPTQGVAHLLTFEDAGGAILLEVFTTETSFTPDAAAWASLAAATDPLAASLVTATYESNRIVSGGGPFAGQRIQFSIE